MEQASNRRDWKLPECQETDVPSSLPLAYSKPPAGNGLQRKNYVELNDANLPRPQPFTTSSQTKLHRSPLHSGLLSMLLTRTTDPTLILTQALIQNIHLMRHIEFGEVGFPRVVCRVLPPLYLTSFIKPAGFEGHKSMHFLSLLKKMQERACQCTCEILCCGTVWLTTVV